MSQALNASVRKNQTVLFSQLFGLQESIVADAGTKSQLFGAKSQEPMIARDSGIDLGASRPSTVVDFDARSGLWISRDVDPKFPSESHSQVELWPRPKMISIFGKTISIS
jgi:hypothetical protein